MVIEQSLVILKPDALERGLAGEILSRFENTGLRLVAMRQVTASQDILASHYPDTLADAIGEKGLRAGLQLPNGPHAYGVQVLENNREYMSRGPVIVAVLEGEDAVTAIRKMVGYTDPKEASKGTIRGDLGVDSIAIATAEGRATENLVHASGSPAEAADEIALWFPSPKEEETHA